MKTILSWEHSHQTTNPPLHSLETLATGLGIPINIDDQRVVKDLFASLPRLKLVALPKDDYAAYEYEILAKADKWHIPYNKTNPDFCDLENKIHEYEMLIERTVGLQIGWNYEVYDPIGLGEAIEASEDEEYNHGKALWSDYYASRGV